MGDLRFYLTSPGLPGSSNPVLYGKEVIGTGVCFATSRVEFTFDPSLEPDKRLQLARILGSGSRVRGSYHPNAAITNADGTIMIVDGVIEIYVV
jgi:hypothetical protein